ncbi:L,D-transpeptidase [Nostoc sp. FACHB-888]|uniref:L,D-transpeptidase n=1 Tax=Nostoc sp. FACHB-888 TaxID=2692842 RepID=UPI0016864BED|nr:L,D-transpeptidase [Nostoc sp. FACHB-888]MBD2248032.1 L,D-transpeptidase [Nostoc sp. FACHB-888]
MQNKIIKKSLELWTALSIGLGAIALLFWLQSQHTARMSIEKRADSQKTIEKPASPIVKPTVPPASKQHIHLVLKRSMRKVYVYKGDSLQASYPVAVGKPGSETPIGKFKVIEMLKNPDWTHPQTGKLVLPGANNPLGERWIAFWNVGREYIGFHGTPDRISVGKAVSHGCVRMYNKDARELYEMVKLGTPVLVEP